MVTIKKIEIKGFFGKGNFEWNLNPVVNILGGKNGSGKSTIFKFCYTLLLTDRIAVEYEKEIRKVFREVVLTFSNGWKLTWSSNREQGSVILSMDGGVPKPYTMNIVVEDETGNVREHSELKKQINAYLINSFEQHLSKATQYSQQPHSQPLDDPTMLDLMIKDQIDLRNKYFTQAMEESIDDSEEAEKKRKEYVAIYKKTYKVLEHFLTEYNKPYNSTFEFSKNGEKFGYNHLSMGEKQMLLLILMVGNNNQEPCIFFMDEPDLSMHIDWKEQLVTQLHEMNPNMQIILSTHAPSVITGWMDCVNEVSQLIKG